MLLGSSNYMEVYPHDETMDIVVLCVLSVSRIIRC